MKKVFKTFFKMKYNRLLSFIYKKDFCRLYRHSTTAPKEDYSKHQTARENSDNRNQKKIEHKEKRKEKENKHKRKKENNQKIKASAF